VPPRDLEDLGQEVLLSVVKHLPGLPHSGHRGAFRSWLRTIVCRRTADYWRAIDAGTQAIGGSGATARLGSTAGCTGQIDPGAEPVGHPGQALADRAWTAAQGSRIRAASAPDGSRRG
jgi:DNA-directed RNA polymerase specialized sigma24 family protein